MKTTDEVKFNIFILNTEEGTICLNSDNDENDQILLEQGAIQLTDEEIERYGMKGFEAYVSPDTTKILSDGSIKFVPPTQKDIDDGLMMVLRSLRNQKISETDYLMISDYPISEKKKKSIQEYRKALRDITDLPGSPWDGGGPLTPWPKKPKI